eukprot:3381461-Prymnesium_polylepis.1
MQLRLEEASTDDAATPTALCRNAAVPIVGRNGPVARTEATFKRRRLSESLVCEVAPAEIGGKQPTKALVARQLLDSTP